MSSLSRPPIAIFNNFIILTMSSTDLLVSRPSNSVFCTEFCVLLDQCSVLLCTVSGMGKLTLIEGKGNDLFKRLQNGN